MLQQRFSVYFLASYNNYRIKKGGFTQTAFCSLPYQPLTMWGLNAT
jgi:hypothetical protein